MTNLNQRFNLLKVRRKAPQGTTLAGWLTVKIAELIKLANLSQYQLPFLPRGPCAGVVYWLGVYSFIRVRKILEYEEKSIS